MIKVNFKGKNLKLSEEQKYLIINKIVNKFKKMRTDVEFNIITTSNCKRVVMRVHGK